MNYTKQLTLISKVLLKELIVAANEEIYNSFMEPEGSLLHLEESAIGPYPDSEESSPHPHTLFP
jgi:hypothetical protein